ncbi:hypothetical protein QAD02_008915 [Eretmocerus hayati]|uniref:Uncharacterized protein n=1 Tax=Eretmocerus hayati TaxID=131215 RepID=A0ACC2N833_9HYME|nr:hypothetical protein QAD02_008915 [Eretmocerus hayati]
MKLEGVTPTSSSYKTISNFDGLRDVCKKNSSIIQTTLGRRNLGKAATATSCLSSKRTLISNNATATPTQSPTAVLSVDEPLDRSSNSSRKHVQFPDAANETFVGESRMVTKFNVLEDDSSEITPWLNDF